MKDRHIPTRKKKLSWSYHEDRTSTRRQGKTSTPLFCYDSWRFKPTCVLKPKNPAPFGFYVPSYGHIFRFKRQDRQFVYFLLEAALGGDLYGMFSSHQETWCVTLGFQDLNISRSQDLNIAMFTVFDIAAVVFFRRTPKFRNTGMQVPVVGSTVLCPLPWQLWFSEEIFLYDQPRGSTSVALADFRVRAKWFRKTTFPKWFKCVPLPGSNNDLAIGTFCASWVTLWSFMVFQCFWMSFMVIFHFASFASFAAGSLSRPSMEVASLQP